MVLNCAKHHICKDYDKFQKTPVLENHVNGGFHCQATCKVSFSFISPYPSFDSRPVEMYIVMFQFSVAELNNAGAQL